MLTKVEVRNKSGAMLSLPLDDISSGLVVADIDGLDPVKATLVSSNFANQDGAQYQSAKRETRNIKIKLGLSPDYVATSVRDLRKTLYNYFMPKSEINLRFYLDDGPTVEIMGRVETCESALFVKEPEVDISILCFDPDFVELTPVTLSGSSVADSTETLVEYDGTVETGFVFTLNLNRSLSEFTIYLRPPDNILRSIDIAASLLNGDVVKISTVAGAKSVTLTRGGSTTSLLYGMSPQSPWLELQNGDNYLRVYAIGAAIPYGIEYTNRHGGL